MNMTKLSMNQILAKEDDPHGLENLYWSDPEAFKAALLSAAALKPDSTAFQFWRVRLEYNGVFENPSAVPITVVLLLAAFFGLIVRIPENFLTEIWYYPRFAPFLPSCQSPLIFSLRIPIKDFL